MSFQSDPAERHLELRTAAWYGDRIVGLPVPSSWEITTFKPPTGVALDDAQIGQRLESPAGQPTIRELCRGKRRPVVIVDDLNRPTPADRILPIVLRHFESGGIRPADVHIVMAPGTHGLPPTDALTKKVGLEPCRLCRLHIHDCDCDRDLVRIGVTSFGTPVFVNRVVADSDYVVGIGGLYPNHTAGFGGGPKLALGVLGFRSIAALHYGHSSLGWGSANNQCSFRRELDEIATMIGLHTTVSVLLNGDRDIVDLRCGDHHAYYDDLLVTARQASRAPAPDPLADVVIANAYPSDLSLTFVHMKGMTPVGMAPAHASKVVIASCSEGIGLHRLFPFTNAPRWHRERMLSLRASLLLRRPDRLSHVRRLLRRLAVRRTVALPAQSRHPIWLYTTGGDASSASLPREVPGMCVTTSWDDILQAVSDEQGGRKHLRTLVYSSSSQWLDPMIQR